MEVQRDRSGHESKNQCRESCNKHSSFRISYNKHSSFRIRYNKHNSYDEKKREVSPAEVRELAKINFRLLKQKQ